MKIEKMEYKTKKAAEQMAQKVGGQVPYVDYGTYYRYMVYIEKTQDHVWFKGKKSCLGSEFLIKQEVK